MAQDRRSISWFGIVLAILFVAMTVELVLLVRQNTELKSTVARLQAESAAAVTRVAPALKPGETVTPLTLSALWGGVEEVRYDTSDDTVLLVFSPNCPACQLNMDNWKELQQTAPGSRRFYYVSTADEEQTRNYAEAYEIAPVILGDVDSLSSYKITHTPTTIVVGQGGVVKRVWVGMLPEDAALQL